ncbi:putative orfan [Tupanvirus soda lake]|uniref:Orfan n=2 Tax=Tupanvirus TaxID=2094720 RepID=A0AC62ADE5_9VIRU|nr:putative orfan [Tupanvirus soda lake]QKU35784.1 putative orfan [Tupanvirus soda lake]
MDSLYKQKYLKYKAKYLKLLAQQDMLIPKPNSGQIERNSLLNRPYIKPNNDVLNQHDALNQLGSFIGGNRENGRVAVEVKYSGPLSKVKKIVVRNDETFTYYEDNKIKSIGNFTPAQTLEIQLLINTVLSLPDTYKIPKGSPKPKYSMTIDGFTLDPTNEALPVMFKDIYKKLVTVAPDFTKG